MYAKCHMNVMYMHLCPDMSKDFPFILSDLLTTASAFECVFTVLETYSHMSMLLLYVAQAHKHTRARINARANTNYTVEYYPVMF